MYRRTIKPYSKGALNDYLHQQHQKLQQTIQQEKDNDILSVNETEYIEYLASRFHLESPNIDFDNLYIADTIERMIEVRHNPQRRFFNEDNPYLTHPTHIIIFHVPYNGNIDLIGYHPSTFSLNYPSEFIIIGNEVVYEYIDYANGADVNGVKTDIVRLRQSMEPNLERLTSDINTYNQDLTYKIQQAFQKRKQEILKRHNMLTAIGVPIKRREDTPTSFSVPPPSLRTPIKPRPSVPNSPFTPEPTLDDLIYQQVLALLNDAGTILERYPSLQKGKDEEALRDHLLFVLQPNFEGSGTAEAFNRSGKTDILLRHNNTNIFVAECKFWSGAKGYLDTLTQLLGYLTWRDSKSAAIIFVRNKDFSHVINTVQEVTPTHANFLGFVSLQKETWVNYRFHINSDPSREIKLAVTFIPSSRGE